MLCKHTLGPWAPCSEREKHIFSQNSAINSAFCTLNVNKWGKTSDRYHKRQRKLTVSPRLPFCPREPCKVYINQWVCWKTSAQRNVKASVMYKTYCSSIGTNNSYGTNNSSSTLKEKKKKNEHSRAFYQNDLNHHVTYHWSLGPFWPSYALWPKVSWRPLKVIHIYTQPLHTLSVWPKTYVYTNLSLTIDFASSRNTG